MSEFINRTCTRQLAREKVNPVKGTLDQTKKVQKEIRS